MFLKHKGTLLDYLRGVDTPMDRVLAPKTGLSWTNTWGSGEVNMSASIRASYTKFIWEVPEIHSNILDSLGGIDTPVSKVQAPRPSLSWANTWGSGEVYISASIRVPYTKTFWVVPEIYRNIFRPLGQCWHTHGQSASAQHMSKLSKYMEEGRSICQLLWGLQAPIFEGFWGT